MRLIHLGWVITLITSAQAIMEGPSHPRISYPPDGPASPEKLAMERNGTLKGPKVFLPNPGFELNMGKPWKLVGRGVEVVDDISLSRKGRNSLLFTIKSTRQRPEVYSVPLTHLTGHQVYYLTFHYRIIDLNEATEKSQCFITMTLGDMKAGYPIFVKSNEIHEMRRDHLRYKKVTVPIYTMDGIAPLVVSVFCERNIGYGNAMKVSIDDLRLERGEGLYSDWAFDQNRPDYKYGRRDSFRPKLYELDTLWYDWVDIYNTPAACRNYGCYGPICDCSLMGGDWRREDIWDEGVADYFPLENQPGRMVSGIN